jgi:hypothetical protein
MMLLDAGGQPANGPPTLFVGGLAGGFGRHFGEIELIENVLQIDKRGVIGNLAGKPIVPPVAFLLGWAVATDAVGCQKRLDVAVERGGWIGGLSASEALQSDGE